MAAADGCRIVAATKKAVTNTINFNTYQLVQLCEHLLLLHSLLLKPYTEEPVDEVWETLRSEAEEDAVEEPILVKLYRDSVLSHASLERSLASCLASKLGSSTVSAVSLEKALVEVLEKDKAIGRSVRADLRAARDRDPACSRMIHCFLYYKGFQALQAHRIAHRLWLDGRRALALLLQSRTSEVFAVDVHPAATIGSGILLDHGTGVVIGETAVVGDGVSILHGVTLGGRGNAGGDRHPKIGNGVLVGAGTKILGNVRIGDGAKVGAGSVVLKEVPAGSTVVGNPARVVAVKEKGG